MDTKEHLSLLIVSPDLSHGGTQGYVKKLVKDLGSCAKAQLVILTGAKTTNKYDFIGSQRVLTSIIKLYSYLEEVKPKKILVVMDHALLAVIIANCFTKVKSEIIYRPSSIPSVMRSYYKFGRLRLGFERMLIKTFVSKILFQSEDQAREYPLIRDYIVLGNYCNVRGRYEHSNRIKLLSIGRLSLEKGYDRILKCLSQCSGLESYEYHIFGDGSYKNELQVAIQKLNLNDKVRLRGYYELDDILKEPWSLYIQGSYVEGFPNALLEVLTSGMPSLCFPALGGTKELNSAFTNCFMTDKESFCNDLKRVLSLDKKLEDGGKGAQFNRENYIEKIIEFING